MNSIHIRRGIASDASALSAFAARTFTEAFVADNQPEDMRAHIAATYSVAQQTKELTDPHFATLLAYRDETLLAYAQVRRKLPPPCVTQAQPVQLYRFYVDRVAHGSGVAQKLMTAVHQTASEFGAQHLWLNAWEHNPRALAFYTKAGFKDVGSTDFYVGSDRQIDRVLVSVVQP
jgi:diamine N-acetyltransferase